VASINKINDLGRKSPARNGWRFCSWGARQGFIRGNWREFFNFCAIFGKIVDSPRKPSVRDFEIRCPIYGFIPLNGWEREIISQPAFQRLRRIRQLAWTDQVYPGAMHNRFEHSLGVMHMVTQLYASIVDRSKAELEGKLGITQVGHDRNRQLVRFAALLHDVGHGPFSHAAEELTPLTPDGSRHYRHEEYSTAIIRRCFRDVIENHPSNNNYNFTLDEVVGLIEGGVKAGRAALWGDLVSGQLDGDRMDYLLRDSYHAGVEYGRYDWRRIVATVRLAADPESGAPKLGIADDGRHAAEGMIIARYMMFNQVYFHKSRVILDYHLQHALAELLPGGHLPPPVDGGIDEYLTWDDWRVLGELASGRGGEHGTRLVGRDFFRLVLETSEFPGPEEEDYLAEIKDKLEPYGVVRLDATKSWYKVGASDLPIAFNNGSSKPLSMCSTIVQHMEPTRRSRLYVPSEKRAKALQIIAGVAG